MSQTSMKLVVGHDSGEFYINRFAGVNPVNGDALWYTLRRAGYAQRHIVGGRGAGSAGRLRG